MLKTLMLTAATLALITSTSLADDFLTELSNVDVSSFADADISIEDDVLGDLDVDALASEAGTEGEDAIEACFRRCGYRSYGCHYGNFGYGYNHGYNYGCNYHCYQPVYHQYYCHRPVYTTYQVSYCPTYSYWGCY